MKDIPGYEGLYAGTEDGHIWSYNSKILLKESIDKDGYHSVTLYKNGHPRRIGVHRLICMAYHENPENKPTVNHKNHIRDDNRLENLNWATHPEQFDELQHENHLKAVRGAYTRPEVLARRSKVSKEVMSRPGMRERLSKTHSKLIRCIETEVVYSSQRVAAFYFGVREGVMSYHLNGHKSDINGFHFERI